MVVVRFTIIGDLTEVFLIFLVIFSLCGIARADLKTGLVGYYPFNGNANDESGNGNNGIVHGATLTTDRFSKTNSAYKFVGNETKNYIDLTRTESLDFLTGFSLTAWVEFIDDNINCLNTGCETIIVGKHFCGYQNSYFISSLNGALSFYLNDDNRLTTTKKYNDGKWHLVVGVYDGRTQYLFIDGVLHLSQPKMYGISNNNNIGIGGGTDGNISCINNMYFTGKIDDVRIYNRAISTSEIQQIYKEETHQSPTITSFTATPKSGNPTLTVNFNVTAKDPDGSIVAYKWDFDGNGKIDSTTTTGNTTYTYPDLGTFKANVTVVDNKGGKVVSNVIPITVAYGPDLVGKVETYDFSDVTNTIHIDFKISNTGKIDTPAFKVRFHISNNGTTLLPAFKEIDVSQGLEVGGSEVLRVDNTFENSIYGKSIFVIVDPTKQAAEVDETNNGTVIVIKPIKTK